MRVDGSPEMHSVGNVTPLRTAPRAPDELEALRRQTAMLRARVHVLETAYYAGLAPDLAASQRELALRAVALDAAERALAARESQLEQAAEKLAAARAALAAAQRSHALEEELSVELSDWRVELLERIAQERAPSHLQRVEEWQCYLKVLREVADSDGRLPRSLDWLIEETFGDALPA